MYITDIGLYMYITDFLLDLKMKFDKH